MAQSSNLFGFFLEAAKDTGASAAETVTSFADTLTTALSKATSDLLPSRDVIPSILRAIDKLPTPTISGIVTETGLPLDIVATALQTAERVGLIRQFPMGDAVSYAPTSEGKKVI